MSWTKLPLGQPEHNWTIIAVYTSAVNWSNVKPKYFLGSLNNSKETPNSFNRFDWGFQSEFGDISDCREFSLFETKTGMHKLAEFVHYKSIIISRIAWLYISKKHRIFSLGSKDASCSNLLNISNRRCKRNHAWKCSPKQDQVESPLRRHQSGSSSPILKKNGWWRTSTSLLFGSGMWRAFALFENKNDALIFFILPEWKTQQH